MCVALFLWKEVKSIHAQAMLSNGYHLRNISQKLLKMEVYPHGQNGTVQP